MLAAITMAPAWKLVCCQSRRREILIPGGKLQLGILYGETC